MHAGVYDFYDDGLPLWQQPGVEDWGPESLDDEDESPKYEGSEPVLLLPPEALGIGDPVPNSWGGARSACAERLLARTDGGRRR